MFDSAKRRVLHATITDTVHDTTMGDHNMKAALLYGCDQEMNVDLKIEDVPAPAINAPDEVH